MDDIGYDTPAQRAQRDRDYRAAQRQAETARKVLAAKYGRK